MFRTIVSLAVYTIIAAAIATALLISVSIGLSGVYLMVGIMLVGVILAATF